METFEISGYKTGISRAGVNYLQPSDSFQNIVNGFVHRQVLQSRQGSSTFGDRLDDKTRVYGIFEFIKPDASKELLAFDKNFLYTFNQGTNAWDQVPFGGSMAAYTGFNITSPDQYISGTSYPMAQFLSNGAANPAFGSNGARFIFVGEGLTTSGGSAIFFYNGTDVRDFTNIADNPNYVAPPQGALSRATYVLWFNERLNFVVPVINAIEYQQGVLFSGIRTSDGNGDNFNISGSGLFQADTSQNITGISILGQFLLLNFNRSAYTLEKTTDAFNPYLGRAIPSVLGTDAKFSAVQWNDEVKSVGKTGILSSDGRRSLRTDDKIPDFTTDDIDQIDFNFTYGGFDRDNSQFLWAYKNSESELNTQDRILVHSYEEQSWSVYDQRFSVFGQTDLGTELTWDDIDETSGNLSWAMWDTTEEIWNKIGISQTVQKTLAGDDLGFVYELNRMGSDYFSTISAIASGATTTLTVAETGILPGDLVVVSNVEGMTQINNYDTTSDQITTNLYTVLTGSTDTSIILNVDSTLFDAYTTGGFIEKIINFSAETIPFNPYREQGRRVYVSHVEFLIETNGGNLSLDIFADQQETPFKQNVLLNPSKTNQSAEYITVTVDQEANFLTFLLKQASVSLQLKLTLMRIHAMPGGLISG